MVVKQLTLLIQGKMSKDKIMQIPKFILAQIIVKLRVLFLPFFKIDRKSLFRVYSIIFSDSFFRKQEVCEVKVKKIKHFVYFKQDSKHSFIHSLFAKFHRELIPLKSKTPVILDLGSNLGFTIIDFKLSYPKSRIIGCEMDKKNFYLLEKNIKNISDCTVYNNAVTNKKSVTYSSNFDSESYHISPKAKSSNSDLITVKGISIQEIIRMNNLEEIDYIKMDIEGEEGEIFDADLSFLDITKQIQIECHPQFNPKATVSSISETLKKKGFKVFNSPLHMYSVFGINKKL